MIDIADRSKVFYWQTDRAIEPKIAGKIWADRHRYFSDNELLERANLMLSEDKLAYIKPIDPEDQTNLGNVNSVRTGTLTSGRQIIMRCHPKGIRNGYFHVEACASALAKNTGIPCFDTLAIHDYDTGDDFAFHIIEKLPGTAVKKWLDANPDDEATLLPKIGIMMAKLHKITVDGFGPFNNELAKSGTLVGVHKTLAQSMRAGLAFNLDVLVKEGLLQPKQAPEIAAFFSDSNKLLKPGQAVLVHNDFADWNLLTDGKDVTGILDWDECVGSDPIADIACWSTFFEPKRLQAFLDGYWQIADKPSDFKEKFELFRLRYILSKMTLRIRRYSWDPSDAMMEKIINGKMHLNQSLKYFKL